jgi:hypothetical protein
MIQFEIISKYIGTYQLQIVDFQPNQPCSYLETVDGKLQWVVKRYEDRSDVLITFEKCFDSREESEKFANTDKLFKKIFKTMVLAHSKGAMKF